MLDLLIVTLLNFKVTFWNTLLYKGDRTDKFTFFYQTIQKKFFTDEKMSVCKFGYVLLDLLLMLIFTLLKFKVTFGNTLLYKGDRTDKFTFFYQKIKKKVFYS